MKRIIAILATILMLATPVIFSDSATMEVIVVNAAPTVDNIKINNTDIEATVTPSAGTTTTVTLVAEASDNDGHADISSVICTINGSVQDSPVTLSFNSSIDSTKANYTGTFDMDFYDVAGTYNVTCVATDDSAAKGSRQEDFTYTTAIALELDAETVGFGSMSSGATSTVTGDSDMGTPNNATIQNYGNVQIDAQISGTDLSDGTNTIEVENVDYRFAAIAFKDLLETTQTEDINLIAGETSTTNVDFKLYVPIGTVTGTYSEDVVISAVAG